jgi:hypothetical protein
LRILCPDFADLVRSQWDEKANDVTSGVRPSNVLSVLLNSRRCVSVRVGIGCTWSCRGVEDEGEYCHHHNRSSRYVFLSSIHAKGEHSVGLLKTEPSHILSPQQFMVAQNSATSSALPLPAPPPPSSLTYNLFPAPLPASTSNASNDYNVRRF